MAKDRVAKKLTTIVSVDVAGYSRLMEADEAGTLAALKAHRSVTDPKVEEYEGRIVGTAGDGLLIEFPSVADAVSCAIDVQALMAKRNADMPADQRMQFRIGINLGDVLIEEDDIFGTGVNVAARLQELAEPGGICVSRSVFNQVKAMGEVGFADLGPQKVKNIAEPVPAYKVLLDPGAAGTVVAAKRSGLGLRWWTMAAAVAALFVVIGGAWWQPWLTRVEPASLSKMAFPLPKKPSIAVLPFDNLSGDKKHDYLSDGLSENIISTLSKIPEMFVIARNSTFFYKGKAVKVRRVAEELGVRYVLEGSVQKEKDGDRIRVTAQLIDAVKGHHLWSERYDRKLTDLFAVQDEITRKIVVALQVKLTEGEQALVWRRQTNNYEAFVLFLKGREHYFRFTKDDNSLSRRYIRQAVTLDPGFAQAWVGMAWTHHAAARWGWSSDKSADTRRAVELARKALKLDPGAADPYVLLGSLALYGRRHDEAIVLGKKAVALSPSNADATALLAQFYTMAGRPDEAIVLIERAQRLHPRYPSWHLWILSQAYLLKNEFDKAISAAEAFRARTPNSHLPYIMLAQAYMAAGRKSAAQGAAAEVLRRQPNFSCRRYRRAQPFRDSATRDRFSAWLCGAGLPDGTPPLPKKPSIAVLPFTNMSGDKAQAYFTDGMRDDLITSLAKVSGMIVTSRTSTNAAARAKKPIKEIARLLGVRYVLEGSVRRDGSMVRINAQLIDASTDSHVWAETFDREYKAIFDVQKELKEKIVEALKVKLTPKQRKQLKRKPTKNLEAYDLYLKAEKLRLTYDARKYREAFALYDKALALDPDFIDAHVGNAYASFRAWRLGVPRLIFPATAKFRARRSLAKALALDPDNVGALALQADMQLNLHNHDVALALARGAVARHPQNAHLRSRLGRVLLASDKLDEARKALKQAEALAPKPSPELRLDLSQDYLMLGDAKRAVPLLLHSRKFGSSRFITALFLANAYARLGNMEKAKAELETARKFWPSMSGASLRVSFAHYRNKRLLKDFLNGFLKAGMPEWPYGFKGRSELRLKKTELEALYRRGPYREIGTNFTTRYEWHGDGEGNFTVGLTDTRLVGTNAIKGNMFCIRREGHGMGRQYCGDVYRNPKGSPRTNDEYIRINYRGKRAFSIKPLEKK